MEVNTNSIAIVGAKAIGAAVGVSWKNLRYFVEEKGLPAFRIDNTGRWVALPEDLSRWLVQQRDEQLPGRPKT